MRPAVPCVLTVIHSGARWARMLCWRGVVYARGATTSLRFLRGAEGRRLFETQSDPFASELRQCLTTQL